jgi:hypothetical protein
MRGAKSTEWPGKSTRRSSAEMVTFIIAFAIAAYDDLAGHKKLENADTNGSYRLQCS